MDDAARGDDEAIAARGEAMTTRRGEAMVRRREATGLDGAIAAGGEAMVTRREARTMATRREARRCRRSARLGESDAARGR